DGRHSAGRDRALRQAAAARRLCAARLAGRLRAALGRLARRLHGGRPGGARPGRLGRGLAGHGGLALPGRGRAFRPLDAHRRPGAEPRRRRARLSPHAPGPGAGRCAGGGVVRTSRRARRRGRGRWPGRRRPRRGAAPGLGERHVDAHRRAGRDRLVATGHGSGGHAPQPGQSPPPARTGSGPAM
ncbi:MAG: hypothetical protein AVDCRST_MAG04-2166, partial [uncultured Acetobacteraceae bacterium]